MSLKTLTMTAALVVSAGSFASENALHAADGQGAAVTSGPAAQAQEKKAESQEPGSPKSEAQNAQSQKVEDAKKAQEVRKARAKSENNLKQIALAMHTIASLSDSLRFPGAAIRDKNGKPLLSWRVAILPYLEQKPLYDKFHLDEPWDSPHNKALLKEIPEIFIPVIRSDEPKISTYYQVFTGPGALFENAAGPALQEITDGTSNTLLVVEAGSPVPWTKPEDLTVEKDEERPLPKLGRLFGTGFNAAFADGSVRFLSTAITDDVLKKLVTRNGGEIITPEMLERGRKPDEE